MKSKGTLFALLSGICSGLAPLFSKIAMGAGLTPFTLLFARVFFSAVILLFVVKSRGPIAKLTAIQLRAVLFVSAAFTATLGSLIYSYTLIPSGVAMTFHFGYPIFVVLLAFIFFRQKPTSMQIVCIFLALTGVVLMQNTAGGLHPVGVATATFSGISYATYLLTINKSSLSQLEPLQLNLYIHWFCTLFVLLAWPLQGKVPLSTSLVGWGAALGGAVVVSVLAMTLLQSSLRLISAQTASILTTLEPVTSVLVGVFIFQENLSLKSVIGLVLVLGSVVILSTAKERPAGALSNK